MGFYKKREDYLRRLAEAHALVRHNQPDDTQLLAGANNQFILTEDNLPVLLEFYSDGNATRRRSFFRINDEAELMAACNTWAHFPCVVQYNLSGRNISKGGSVRQLNENTWLFLAPVSLDPNDPVFATALTEAYDQTFDVMQDFKNAVAAEMEENEGCGVFYRLEDAFGEWARYGPAGDNLYGWIFSFNDETRPF